MQRATLRRMDDVRRATDNVATDGRRATCNRQRRNGWTTDDMQRTPTTCANLHRAADSTRRATGGNVATDKVAADNVAADNVAADNVAADNVAADNVARNAHRNGRRRNTQRTPRKRAPLQRMDNVATDGQRCNGWRTLQRNSDDRRQTPPRRASCNMLAASGVPEATVSMPFQVIGARARTRKHAHAHADARPHRC
jgi:hypothetical protein